MVTFEIDITVEAFVYWLDGLSKNAMEFRSKCDIKRDENMCCVKLHCSIPFKNEDFWAEEQWSPFTNYVKFDIWPLSDNRVMVTVNMGIRDLERFGLLQALVRAFPEIPNTLMPTALTLPGPAGGHLETKNQPKKVGRKPLTEAEKTERRQKVLKVLEIAEREHISQEQACARVDGIPFRSFREWRKYLDE